MSEQRAPAPGADMGWAMTQRDLLLEVRSDLKALRGEVESIAKDQAVAVERRSTMFDRAARIDGEISRLRSEFTAISSEQEAQREFMAELRTAVKFARWALGTSGIAAVLLIIQLASDVLHAIHPALP